MTLDRIHEFYENTYFCQVSKWGKDLTEEDAIKLGILSAPAKTPVKRTTRKKVSEPNTKEVIE